MLKLYYFARADQMQGHNFTDDVAVTLATCKPHAVYKFSKLYLGVKPSEVRPIRIKYLLRECEILTDY